MFLIIGLGNPGKKYEKTRHNVGFRVIEKLLNDRLTTVDKKQKFGAEIFETEVTGKKAILAKPQTFMNLSGQTVKSLIRNYKIKTANLVVIHDDIDLPSGKIKVSTNRGSAGHKGVQSIIDALGTKNFTRLRIGIKYHQATIKNVEKFVLQKFTRNEEKTLKDVFRNSTEAIKILLKEKAEKEM